SLHALAADAGITLLLKNAVTDGTVKDRAAGSGERALAGCTQARLLTQPSRRPHETTGSAFSPSYVAWREYTVPVSQPGVLPNGDPKSDHGVYARAPSLSRAFVATDMA